MADSFSVTLNSLNRSYNIPTGGATDWRDSMSRYIRDSATVINSLVSGSLVTPVYNVKNYGATGNGTTDDTTAIQAAMAALALTGTTGGSLYFPSGTYKFTASLQFGVSPTQKNVKLIGDGFSSILKPTGAFSTSPAIEFRNCDYWQISGLKVDASARTGSGDSIRIDGCNYGLLTGCTLVGSPRYGVYLGQVSGSGASTYNCIDGNVFASNTTANVFVGTLTGNTVNQQNATFAAPYVVDIQQRFGVVADGIADDTAAIQAALDFGYNEINAQRPCTLLFPPGGMKITSTLLWRGNSASAPALIGSLAPGNPFSVTLPTTFRWFGVANATMFFAQSANKGLMQNICFDGRNIAGVLCHLSASTYADPAVLAATSGIRIEKCRFTGCKINTVGNGCVALGTDTAFTGGATYQQSEVVFRDCDFIGEDSGAPGFTYANMKAYGIKTLSAGNCKNFAVSDCVFTTCNVPIDWTEASGNFNVYNLNIADCRFGAKQSGGHLIIIGGDVEAGHVDDFRFLSGTGGGGECAADVMGIECIPFLSGATGTMLDWGGQLRLTNCKFVNGNSSVSGNPNIPNPFKMVIGLAADTQSGFVYSVGNIFNGVTNFAPYYDTSGNNLAPIINTNYGGNVATNVYSSGDQGYLDITANPAPLGGINSKITTSFEQRWNGPVNFSYLTSGDPANPYAAFRTICPIDATSGNKTFTLPAAASANLGRVTIVSKHDSSANTVTIGSIVLRDQFECAVFVSNASSWDLLGVFLSAGSQRITGQKTFASPVLYSGTTGITAHAGGGQGSAVALAAEVNFVTTVTTAADSVKLPTAAIGAHIVVWNKGASAMDIFPASGGQIDALGANTAYSLASGSCRVFDGQSATQWYSRA